MASGVRGRPRSTSVPDLEEAAVELFLEQGYESTSIDDIARRAGISRSAFFGYVGAKSDLLWHDVDQVLGRISLADGMDRAAVVDAIAAALEPWGDRVPWMLRETAIMGTDQVLRQSVFERLEPLVARIERTLRAREGRAALHVAAALVTAAATAVVEWSQDGRARGPAADAVRRAGAALG
ncbi:TetR/AcrR family transcriptional regulator [Agrococcus sp. SGAir0287]|uniref:TetR/AcrR family transcriptional regulator n=1 Tax=Agrococcus sp. SGAir0287 TaxID=2070347 RepID=UPI0010CCBDE8|nr:TetR/AcrR family transcriptional regulator [Agrococcus sp. SGAir0287]QCR19078.1 TetR family transcriptional regulator [Agrococcus sp. SGAir0287]